MDQFTLGKTDLKNLIKFYGESPRMFQRVSADVLSKMAFYTKPFYMDVMNQEMNIRVPSLLKASLRYERAKGSQPINQQQSRVGAIRGIKRHDIWEHVDEGGNVRLTAFTSQGRKGGSGISLKQAREKQNQTVPGDVGVSESEPRRYLQAIGRDKARRRKPFLFPKRYKGMKPGVYVFKGSVGTYDKGSRKIRKTMVGPPIRLSTFDSTMHVKPHHISERATRKSMTEPRIKRWWVEAFNENFARRLKAMSRR